MLDSTKGKGPLDSSYNSTDYIYIEWVYGHEGVSFGLTSTPPIQ